MNCCCDARKPGRCVAYTHVSTQLNNSVLVWSDARITTYRCNQVMQEPEWRLGQQLVRQFWFDEDGASWVLQNIQRGIPVLPHDVVNPDQMRDTELLLYLPCHIAHRDRCLCNYFFECTTVEESRVRHDWTIHTNSAHKVPTTACVTQPGSTASGSSTMLEVCHSSPNSISLFLTATLVWSKLFTAAS